MKPFIMLSKLFRRKKLCLLLLGSVLLYSLSFGQHDMRSDAKDTYKTYKVVYVVDGDTFKILYHGKLTSVRLIGIDTPESHHMTDPSRNTVWGKKAAKYSKKMLTGKNVRLTFDRQKTDRYGRVLAYVYLGKSFYNKKLVDKGYARAVYYVPNGKYRKVFERAQKQAKRKKAGFWKDGFSKAFPTL